MRIYTYQPKAKVNVKSTTKKPTGRKWKRDWNWKKIWTWLFRLSALGILAAAIMFLYYSKDLPDPNKLLDRSIPESTKIFARDGSLLYEIHGEYKRTQVTLDQISPYVKNATVAVEDKDFYNHGGISIRGILRSAVVDILTLRKSQGASTITQQFVRNAILTKDKSWDRKIREAILAIAIDARFSKEQILNFYLNEIPYGRNAYGIEAASQTFFNKSAKDLNLAESAYLAALPQSPTYYNPSGPHRADLDARKNTILTLMRQQNYITAEQEQQAKNETVKFSTITNGIKAPHFVLWVEDYLANKYGDKTLEEGGLQIYTTLDPRLQDIAEKVVKENIAKESKKYSVNNAALVAIDPKTGQILAMVGSKDYFGDPEPAGCTPGKNCTFEPNVNVALSQRQPGSSFKPYVYVTAFKPDFKYAPASMLMDVVTNFGTYNGKDYVPHNYNDQNYGPVSMRQALAGSLNIPAVKTLDLVGVDNAVQTARDLGITSPLADCGLSLVLGGCEVRLLDHVAAYATIANMGVKNEKTPILKVLDKTGTTMEEYQSNSKTVLDTKAAYELISIMTDNNARSFIFGASSPLTLPDRPVAAKTGTTQNWHDGWTLGFTPSLAAGVWAGNNDGTLLKKGADGVVVAAPIWHDFMQQALANSPAEAFTQPDGIQNILVDSISGKLPTQYTPSTKTEVFADYSIPTDYDNVHINVPINSQTGQPADSSTPQNQITNKTYTILHSERRDNPNWENPVVAWALANGYQYPPNENLYLPQKNNSGGVSVSIINPQDQAIISSLPLKIEVAASAPDNISRVELSIDGQFFQSLSGAPYSFQINSSPGDGQHVFAVKAIDTTGSSADTSVSVQFALNAPLIISDPPDGSTLTLPANLTAESADYYKTVNFYWQNSKGQTKLIGNANNVSHFGDTYDYSLNWQDAPSAGTYKIYAQTETGLVTPKIKIIIR